MVAPVGETVDFLVKQEEFEPYDADAFSSAAADCRVSQVVDVRKGVHCMIAKAIFTARQATAPEKSR